MSATAPGPSPEFAPETPLPRAAATAAAAAAVIPLSMAWIGDVVPSHRPPVLASFLIGQIAGTTAGVWLGGFAAEHLSWRAPYLQVAVMAGVLLGGLPVGHIGTPMFIAIGALDGLDVGTAFATLLRRQVFAPPRTQAH